MYLLSAFPKKQAEYSISIACIGHEMGHFWEKSKKAKASQPVSRYGRVVSPCEPTLPPGHCVQKDSESLY